MTKKVSPGVTLERVHRLSQLMEPTLLSVDRHASFEIGVVRIRCRNGVDNVTGVVRHHVWSQIYCINTKVVFH